MAYNSTCDDDDYYAILGVPYNADYKAIRKAYLKLSLQYHPDKNTNNHPEQAQAAFVRIGRAYQTLSDPTQRRIYDQTYRSSCSGSNNNNNNGNRYRPSSSSGSASSTRPQYTKQSSFAQDFYESSQCHSTYDYNANTTSGHHYSQYPQQQQYETYRDFFDKTMADLSDDEMNEILGAAAMFSSIIGGIIGAKLLGGSAAKGGIGAGAGSSTSSVNPALSAIGSALGSAIASQAATTILKNSHTQAKQRALNADPSRRQPEHIRDHQTSSPNSKTSYTPPTHNNDGDQDAKSTGHLPQNNWKEIVDNVMSGPIAKEAGKVVQQVVNDFINGSNTNKNRK
jgi:curved DNA-binding protein CbpA